MGHSVKVYVGKLIVFKVSRMGHSVKVYVGNFNCF